MTGADTVRVVVKGSIMSKRSGNIRKKKVMKRGWGGREDGR